MEQVACILCGLDDSAPLFAGRDRLLGGTETFQWVRCRGCGLLYLNPRPSLAEMSRYYPADYEPFVRQERAGGTLGHRLAIAKKCHVASRGLESGRLLDVGCGSGDFLLGMQERGWQVHGLDISPEAVALARQNGLDVFLGQLFEAPFEDHSFDLVTMWDVLEHLHDPAAYLAQLARLLKPGGRFVVTLPNPRSVDFRLFGQVWTGLDVPRHLYVFSRPVLSALLCRAGLKVASARCIIGGQRVSTWSLEWLIDERVARQGIRRFLKRAIYTPAWYWFWRPWYFGLDLLGLGSSITYTCVGDGGAS
jgi:SAM-dependent methyltransferase